MLKIGLSSCSKPLTDETFASYAKAGIKAMEISVSLEESKKTDFAEIKKLADKHSVELWSYHLPFMPFEEIDISSPDETLRLNSVDFLCGLIQKAASAGINKFVIHPSGEPIADAERPMHMESSKKSLAALAEFAHKFGAVIAVEDLPRTCLGKNSDEIEELLSADDRLRVCFDTNHLLAEDFVDFIKNVGDKIITTHISDYDFEDEKHWLPGEGDIDWRRLYNALVDAGYNGVWLYELGFGAGRNIVRCRDLTCDDFVNNAKEIFENKEITVVDGKISK